MEASNGRAGNRHHEVEILRGAGSYTDRPPPLHGAMSPKAAAAAPAAAPPPHPARFSGIAAAISPCCFITALMRSGSGGPPAFTTAAMSRKYFGPMVAGVSTLSTLAGAAPLLTKWCTLPLGAKARSPG